ncbi:MAG TPA: GNAT family N-acetyltransferase [Candidatus Dormibacteraeota bacterium]|nr:GNAT family N-acetyltransferase [Candidatus Dormibacteraeota bacterium]
MGALHVRAWRAAYRGQMPDGYLDGLEPASRAAMWRRSVTSPRDHSRLLVADLDGAVVAFAAVGPGGDPPGVGKLYAINVDPDEQGHGVGRTLLEAAEQVLAGLGFAEAVLWVLPANERARRFYERAGWRAEGVERTVDVLGVTVPEVRYRTSLRAGA